MSDINYEDVADVVEQDAVELPQDMIPDADVVDGHKELYQLFIVECAKPKKKAISTLSGFLSEDVDIQKDLLNDYAHSVLKSMTADGDIRVKCNDYHLPIVRDGKTVVIDCENNHLRNADITKAITIKIVRLFPSVREILADIHAEIQRNVPVLPPQAIRVVAKCWKSMDENDEYFLPPVFRERLCNVIQSIVFRDVATNCDTIVRTIKDVASQVLYMIHKQKLVKDVMPTNAKLAIQIELMEHIKNITEGLKSDNPDVRAETRENCLMQIRALGF